MELPASERFGYLKEMFPNIPDEILTEQLQGYAISVSLLIYRIIPTKFAHLRLPQSSSVDQLVDYFLSVSENFGQNSAPEAAGEVRKYFVPHP